jgi:hypothetical protein
MHIRPGGRESQSPGLLSGVGRGGRGSGEPGVGLGARVATSPRWALGACGWGPGRWQGPKGRLSREGQEKVEVCLRLVHVGGEEQGARVGTMMATSAHHDGRHHWSVCQLLLSQPGHQVRLHETPRLPPHLQAGMIGDWIGAGEAGRVGSGRHPGSAPGAGL